MPTISQVVTISTSYLAGVCSSVLPCWVRSWSAPGVGVEEHEFVGIAFGDGDGSGYGVDDHSLGCRSDRYEPSGDRGRLCGRGLWLGGGGSASAGGRVPSVGTLVGNSPEGVGAFGAGVAGCSQPPATLMAATAAAARTLSGRSGITVAPE